MLITLGYDLIYEFEQAHFLFGSTAPVLMFIPG
jgi:hypothetical protein